jgi:hypothetical protein
MFCFRFSIISVYIMLKHEFCCRHSAYGHYYNILNFHFQYAKYMKSQYSQLKKYYISIRSYPFYMFKFMTSIS